MKTKKALLPILASALLLTMGLSACNKPAEGSKPAESSAAQVSSGEEEKIVVTSAGNKKEIQVGETLQLTASVDGVEWSTKNTDIVSVSATGLVTALKDGTARVTAKKDGYANGSFTVTVAKAPEKEAKYTIDLEDADHYSPTDIWGMDLSAYGMGFMGPGDSPVEDNGGATEDSHSLGWLQAGCKETLTFTSNKAAQVEIGVAMAYNADTDLGNALKVTFNGAEISMAGKTCPGPDDGDTNNYYDFHTVSFGNVNLVAGNNVLVIEMIAQGPNMDVFRIFTNETLTINVVKPVQKEQIVVTPTEVELEVGQTQQITSATTGLTYESSDASVASVSSSGLITAVKRGTATITVTKENMKKAQVAVTVKDVPVAGQVIIEAESAVLPEGSSIQFENDGAASGAKSLGYFGEGQSFELKYTADAAKTYKLSMVVSSASLKSDWSGFAEFPLSDAVMTLKLNNAAVSVGTHTLPESQGWTKNWVEIDLGNVTLKQGENVFSFTAISQGPNIDCLKLSVPQA